MQVCALYRKDKVDFLAGSCNDQSGRHSITHHREPTIRATLDIADNVLFAARDLACERKSLGQVISELARRAFSVPANATLTVPPTAANLACERLATRVRQLNL